MFNTLSFSVVLSGLCLTAQVSGANIVWVSFHGADGVPSSEAANAGFTEAPDAAYTDLLMRAGYEVTRYVPTSSLDAELLNQADLVIISRSVASNRYQDEGATLWNRIQAPMMILGGYVLRSSRMGYTDGTTLVDTGGDIMLTVNQPDHPIFAGISLTDGTMDNPFAGVAVYPTDGATFARGISINTNTPDDEGTVLATISEGSAGPVGGMVIAEWPAGATLTHTGGAETDVLGGPRLVFLTGAREAIGFSSETAGLYDLSEDGAQMFLNAVAMYASPVTAHAPSPADGAQAVRLATTLTWQAAPDAVSHDVYFGDDAAGVAEAQAEPGDPYFMGNQLEPALYKGQLEFYEDYYWRIDEVGADASVQPGDVWQFKTANHILIDDFENYPDELGRPIDQVWIPAGGATALTHDSTQSYQGRYSMAFTYGGEDSSVSLPLEGFEDLPLEEITALSLWFRGRPNNEPGTLYVALRADGEWRMVPHPDEHAVSAWRWTNWRIPLSEFMVGVGDFTTVTGVSIGVLTNGGGPPAPPNGVVGLASGPCPEDLDGDANTINVDYWTGSIPALDGFIRDLLTGGPVTGANNALVTLTWDNGTGSRQDSADHNGYFWLWLGDSTYDATATADDFDPSDSWFVEESAHRDFLLKPTAHDVPDRCVYRFGAPGDCNDWCFFTTDAGTRDLLLEDPLQWKYEGIAFRAAKPTASDLVEVYHLWSETFGHFYTTSTVTKQKRKDEGWQGEEEAAFKAYGSKQGDSEPVYHLFFEKLGYHFYTMSKDERDKLSSKGWTFEADDIAWWADKPPVQ